MNDISTLTQTELKRLQSRGIIEVRIKPGYEGKDISTMEITDLQDFKPYKKLLGKGISISEASRRYRLNHSVISRWVRDGHIPNLGMEKNRKLVDEAYIAYYANEYNKIAKSGRRTDKLLFG